MALETMTVPEKAPGAIIGEVSVSDPDLPNDQHQFFVFNDNRFEVVDLMLKLKDGVQLLFASGATVPIAVTAVDAQGKWVSVDFLLHVIQSAGSPPTDILISPLIVPEKLAGAPIGTVEVIDVDLPADVHTFVINDVRFEIVDGILKLKDGVEVDFDVAQSINISVTATDQTDLSKTVNFTIEVTEQILPDPNHAPTSLSLSATTIEDLIFGDVIGTVTVQDEDLPGDTIHLTIADDRFVIIGNELRLKPVYRVSGLTEPTVTVSITATDAAGAFVTREQVLSVATAAQPDLLNAVFVSPGGGGLVNGTSFANAFAVGSLNTAITQAATQGKMVLLASHLGDYSSTTPPNISVGGSIGAAVKVWGCDAEGNAADAIFQGTRADPWTAGAEQGATVLQLITGANHLHFRNLVFRDVRAGFRVANDMTDMIFDNCGADNIERFFDNLLTGEVTAATLTNSTFRNCYTTRYSRGHIRLQYDTHHIMIENSFGDSSVLGGNFPVGIGLFGTAHDITVTDTEMRNNAGPPADPTPSNPGGNPNGDGFSSEQGNYNIKWIRCRATGNIDGGFDLKEGINNTLPHSQWGLFDCWSADNKKNYRLWRENQLVRCVGADPNSHANPNINESQVHLPSTGTIMPHIDVIDCAFVASERPVPNPLTGIIMDCVFDPSTIQTVDPTATLDITNTSVQKHPDTPMENPGHQATVTGIPAQIRTAPAIVTPPVITGDGVAGQPISCNTGTWNTAVTPFFQWLRGGNYIDDARGADYIPTDADIGATIQCRVFGKSAAGYIGSAIATFGGSVSPTIPVNTVLPAISGIRVVGGVLTVIPGTWDGIPAPTFTYRWTRDGAQISGAVNLTYTLTAADAGTLIRIREIATNVAGAVTATSNPTNPIGASGSQVEFHLRPVAAGVKDGTSWANAVGGLEALNGVLAAAAPAAALGSDPIIYIRADEGHYSRSSSMTLSGGAGVTGHHITIRGVDVNKVPMLAEIRGTRTIWTQPGVGTLTNPFTTTTGSPIVTVAHVAHGRVAGNSVNFSGATAVGGITINDRYTVNASGLTADVYTITHHINASSGATGGGTVAYDYEVVTNVSNWADGPQIFTCISATHHLTFEFLNFVRCGDGCFKLSGAAHHLTIQDCAFFNVKRFFEMPAGQAGVTDMIFRRITGVGHSECGIRIRGTGSNWLIEDCDFNSARQNKDNFAICYDGSENASNIVLTRCIGRNCYDDVSSYWNGDAFKNEDGNDNWTFTNCEGYGCTDAGFDLKGTNQTLVNCIAANNKRNFRFWCDGIATDCISRTPFKRGGTGSTWQFGVLSNNNNHMILVRPVVVAHAQSTQFSAEANSQLLVQDEDLSQSVDGTNIDTGVLIFHTAADVTPATVTTPLVHEVFDGVPFSTAVGTSEPVLQKLLGNNDGALFFRGHYTYSLAAKSVSTPQDTDLNNVYSFRVQMTDSGRNVSTQDITVEVKLPYAQAVTFDGANDYLTKGTNISSQSNVPYFFAAGRIKFNGGDGVQQRFFTQSGGVAQITRLATNKMFVSVAGGAGQQFNFPSLSSFVVADGWIDFIIYVDTNNAAGQKVGRIWKRTNGLGQWINDTGVITDADAAFNISYQSRNNWGIFASNAGADKFNGDASDFLIALSQGPHPDLQATRDKWSLNNGTWVYPGAGGTTFLGHLPRFAFSGKANVYAVNKGNGGNTTLNGTLTDSAMPPP